MINVNQLIQPLRVWTSRYYTLSNRHLISNHYDIPNLIVDKNTLTPFIFTRFRGYDTEAERLQKYAITEVNIIDSKGNSTNIVSSMRFAFGQEENSPGIIKEYIAYLGDFGGINLNLKQGKYYLQIKDAYNRYPYSPNIWYSENFKIGVFTNTIKFRYTLTNNLNFGDVWFPPPTNGVFYYELELAKAWTYDKGEYNAFSESTSDKENDTIYGRERFRKLRVCALMGDSNSSDCLQLIRRISHMPEGRVYLTDETGYENLIQIEDIQTERNSGNYLSISVTYSIKDSDIINFKNQSITFTFTQSTGTTPTLDEPGTKILRTHSKKVITHGKKIKIRQ